MGAPQIKYLKEVFRFSTNEKKTLCFVECLFENSDHQCNVEIIKTLDKNMYCHNLFIWPVWINILLSLIYYHNYFLIDLIDNSTDRAGRTSSTVAILYTYIHITIINKYIYNQNQNFFTFFSQLYVFSYINPLSAEGTILKPVSKVKLNSSWLQPIFDLTEVIVITHRDVYYHNLEIINLLLWKK